jgi:AcrR family transcriptional regulator
MAGTAERTKREERAEQTRGRIVRAAWEVIAEHGMAGTTTRLVAARAGISHGMCHYHFATKDEMVLAVVDEARRFWIEPMEALLGSGGTAFDRLERVVAWMAEPATIDVMRVHLQLVSQAEYSEPLRRLMAAEYARWHRAYVELFRQLAAERRLREGVDAEPAGIAFATLADGLVDQQSLDPAMDNRGIMWAFLGTVLQGGRQAG